jgi:hypothetical protein
MKNRIPSRLAKGLKATLLLPLYVYRIKQRLEQLDAFIRDFRRLLELSLPTIPALVPADFRPIHCKNLVRLGGRHDGGYLLPQEVITGSEVLVSYGINLDWEFEKSFRALSPVLVHAYDQSTQQLLEESSAVTRSAFNSFFDDKGAFYHSRFIGDGAKGTVRVQDTLAPHAGRRIFLKFDIEGAEYHRGVFDELMNLPENVIGVAAEFHNFSEMASFVRRFIHANKFHIAHLHVNNNGGISDNLTPNLLELTLVREPYFTPSGHFTAYPLDNDSACRADIPEIRPIFYR